MTTVDVNDFSCEKECIFEDERYLVRDNGSVFRHSRQGKRARPIDDQWTFGDINSNNPYLHIAGIRVHRIVATAFHGEPPDPKYVVDHIDSNCRNNRPENLRWLTRLENTLKNPVTRRKIEYLCGSIEAFLENPSMLNNKNLEPNVAWMRTVTLEEAQNCKMRMHIWASSENRKYSDTSFYEKSSFAKRVYKPLQKWEAGLAGEPGLDFAQTPMCGQYMWRSPAHFPCCPQEVGADPLDSYFQNLKSGAVFAYCDYQHSPKLTVVEFAKGKKRPSILVMCEKEGPPQYAIAGIELNEKGFFIHFKLGSYTDKDSADKAFIEKQELTDFWRDGYHGW